MLPCVNGSLYLSFLDFYSTPHSSHLSVHPGPSLRKCHFMLVEHLMSLDMETSDSHMSTSKFPLPCPYSSPSPILPSIPWILCLWNFLSIQKSHSILESSISSSSMRSAHSLSPHLLHARAHAHTHTEAITVVSLSLQ